MRVAVGLFSAFQIEAQATVTYILEPSSGDALEACGSVPAPGGTHCPGRTPSCFCTSHVFTFQGVTGRKHFFFGEQSCV